MARPAAAAKARRSEAVLRWGSRDEHHTSVDLLEHLHDLRLVRPPEIWPRLASLEDHSGFVADRIDRVLFGKEKLAWNYPVAFICLALAAFSLRSHGLLQSLRKY